MKKFLKIGLPVIAIILAALVWWLADGGLSGADIENYTGQEEGIAEVVIDEGGSYTSKDEVARYLRSFGKLPSNYITKAEARELGWDSQEGNLDQVAPGKSIGGDRYGNYENKLPEGEMYRECDIDYEGGRRNAKRLVYSEDGVSVYYTEDHYNTFEQLY